ncbi:MAG: hypothetical protein HN700_18690, partial [Verrucomicrobia bacterium]|nr:hypothetical protein [Verrucomicrobiota bacterium]
MSTPEASRSTNVMDLVRALRPQQWTKNALVGAAFFFAYWDRLLADRGLYQVFVRDPNGVVVELNDYNPDLGAIDPMSVQG